MNTEMRVARRPLFDALAVLALTTLAGTLFATLDAVERLTATLRSFEPFELDDLLLTLCVAVAGALWFSYRRWLDSRSQLAALRQSEDERDRYLRRVEGLSSELLSSEQRERHRVAELLHDGVCQTLYAARLQLDLALPAANPQSAPALRTARDLVLEAMGATKDLTIELSPPVLHDLGLQEALRWLLQRLGGRYGFEGHLADDPEWDAIPEEHRAPLFASIRELLINTGHHARAHAAYVSITRNSPDSLAVTVSDDGGGFDPKARPTSGFGLFSIERRLAFMSGCLHLHSRPGQGTSATLVFASR